LPTKDTKAEEAGRKTIGMSEPNRHRKNAAEWLMLVCIAPFVLIARLWVRLTAR
jgi:hypothetical protein